MHPSSKKFPPTLTMKQTSKSLTVEKEQVR